MNLKFRKILGSNKFIAALFLPFVLIEPMFINWVLNIFKMAIHSLLNRDSEFVLPSFFEFDKQRMPLYLGLLFVSVVLYVILAFRLKTAYGELRKNNADKGTRRFATLEEIEEQYKAVPEKDKSFDGYGGIPISRHKNTIFVDDTTVNSLVYGMTRSGKGETTVIPMLDIISRGSDKASVIVNDPKLELAPACWDNYKERGYNPYLLNLVNPYEGMGYNPLDLIVQAYEKGEYGEAQLLTRAFSFTLFHEDNVKDPAWQNWAISLSNAVILALCDECIKAGHPEQVNPPSVLKFLIRLGMNKTDEKKGKSMLEDYFESLPDDHVAKLQYAAISLAPSEKTRPTIYSMFLQKYEIFSYSPIEYMTTHHSLRLSDIGFGEKPVAVFMCTPEYDESCHFLASLFVQQTNYILSKMAVTADGHCCKRRVHYILDEFGNMPSIPNLQNAVTMGAGRQILYNLFVQSFEQLESKYGKENAQTIRNNCGNTIYIKTNEVNTAKAISAEIGNETVISYRRNGEAFGLHRHIDESVEAHPLLDENKLLDLKEGESVVLRSMLRKNRNGQRIQPMPIYNHGSTAAKLRYEYLTEFNPSAKMPSIPKEDYDINSRIFRATIEEKSNEDELQANPQKHITKDTPFLEYLSDTQLHSLEALCCGFMCDFSYSLLDFKEFINELIEARVITRIEAKNATKYAYDEFIKHGGVEDEQWANTIYST